MKMKNLNLKIIKSCSAAMITLMLGSNCNLCFPLSNGGKTGMDFLKIEAGARQVGMGGAFVGIADDIYSPQWNPAGLSEIKTQEFGFTNINWITGINYNYLGYVNPSISSTIAIGMSYNQLSFVVQEMDQDVLPLGQEEFSYSNLCFSFSKKFKQKISAGINIKVISALVKGYSPQTFLEDIGLIYKISKTKRLGISVQNFGSPMKFINESDPVPLNYKIGMGFFPSDKIIFSVELNKSDTTNINAGIEYMLAKKFILRAGMRSGYDLDGMTFGFGTRLKIKDVDMIRIDYAVAQMGYWGSVQRISLGTEF
ncbi:MAG: hypothetical protein A3J83_01445 [Elusimicrobia bacterium RIFOXYA2_FULL_40_6]|nr:MAG: hypothetical protein A3J83_01445 [Elusimicrobia bacterium RIFOXYA2_FULL_40_6]